MIGIIILNYNTWIETKKCVDSIKSHVSIKDTYKIYIVDNCSTIQISSRDKEEYERDEKIALLFSKENRGYSAGNNIGIKKAMQDGCQYFLISNSDILIVDNSIKVMKEYLNDNVNTLIVGPEIYNAENEFQYIYMLKRLDAVGKLKNMMLSTPFKVFFRKFEKSFIRKESLKLPIKVFGVSGCCFMISKKGVDLLYPLDERTFLYEEEYIIGSIVEKANFDIYVIPNTHVIHAHGVSTGGMTPYTYTCLVNSEQLYLKEYLNEKKMMCKLLVRIRKLRYLILCISKKNYRVFYKKFKNLIKDYQDEVLDFAKQRKKI
ncbi:glycosyltransferase [Candidatus Stoquefichus massiliensis]|uniref:glycosyltransferase n=1 Tax=Candidatus Stoquefichus massiliensis TaxID=1470350 RepID=UPI00048378BB|nr:glycosyltransferase family 2 protein [Candidatus Stoquefichus massiliensis]